MLFALAAAAVGAASLFTWFQLGRAPSLEEELSRRGPFNLVLVTADTLRADKLGCYGNDAIETPALDRLAASGVLFENAATAVPLTLPAHASIFTGSYPVYHGVRGNGGYYLESEQQTLAERLRAAGYATGAFVGAFVLDSRWGLDQGFDHYFDDFDLTAYEEVSLDKVHRRGDAVLEPALEWMEGVSDGEFFTWIHLYDPHTPYDPPEPYRSRYADNPDGLYDGEVAYLDSLIGELMARFEERQLDRSTVVVVVGDHGESLGQHGEATHGYFIYDATMRVPFILRAPLPQLEGRRVEAQVRTIDLMPTLLELMGVPLPETVQGTSLLPLATGERDDLSLSAYGESFLPRDHYGWSALRSLRDRRFHFIDAPRPELFDPRKDSREERNLAVERGDQVRQLQEALQRLVESHRRESPDEPHGPAPAPLDAETEARLNVLGYLGGAGRPAIRPGERLADPKDKLPIYNSMKEAGSHAGEGRLGEALEVVEEVVREDPEVVEAQRLRGNLLERLGRLEEAERAYRHALRLDPEFRPALFGLAFIYKESGRLEEAALGFEQIVRLDERDNRASFMLAQIRIEQSRFEEAWRVLEAAVDAGSESALRHVLMAESLIGLGRLDAADVEIERALALQPRVADAHYHRGQILEQRGDMAGAMAAYRKELEHAPGSFRSHFSLARLLGAMSQPEQMEEHLRRAIEANENFAPAYLYLANAYVEGGDLDQALSFARRGLALRPEARFAALGHFVLADIYQRLGRHEDSRRELARARALEPS